MNKLHQKIIRIISIILSSILLSYGVAVLFTFAISTIIAGWAAFLLTLPAFAYWLYKSKSIRVIWGRTLMALAIESFLLPISMFIFSSVFMIANARTEADILGMIFTGSLGTVASLMIGFTLGIILLLAGLFLLKK